MQARGVKESTMLRERWMSSACWEMKVRLQNAQLRGPVTMPCDDLRAKMLPVGIAVCGVAVGAAESAQRARTVMKPR